MSRLTNNAHLITFANPRSPISESYRMLRTNIQFSMKNKQVKVIAVTSAQQGEGKTTTISNLAVTYAENGKRVLLIDANLRSPKLDQLFSQNNQSGLSEVLTEISDWNNVVQNTDIDNLFILTSGSTPRNPSEVISNNRMSNLLTELREHYDMILIDTPPIMEATDGLIVSSECDGVVMVVAAGKAKKEVVKKAKTLLERVNTPIIGAVFNDLTLKRKNVNKTY